MLTKKNVLKIVFGIIAVFALMVLLGSLYIVKPNQSAIVVRLNKAQEVVSTPGLHIHAPFIDSVVNVYTGDMLYDIPVSDVITADKKSMIADNYVIWKRIGYHAI